MPASLPATTVEGAEHPGPTPPPIELTILMPCLNEAETLPACIAMARGFLEESGIAGEILVADNASTDDSRAFALREGARVVRIERKGYGAALTGGIAAARGRYVIMGDCDGSYDFTHLGPFLSRLREGFDLVVGNRFAGGIAPGAMPPLHRFLGNPVLTGIGRLFYGSDLRDFHCGLRGFRKSAIEGLGLKTGGMEFASEMIVQATLYKLKVTQVPTTLSPDGRSKPSHLRSWADGWRHLRFLLMYAPRWLFLLPALSLLLFGLLVTVLVLPGPFQLGGVVFDVHTLLVGMVCILTGLQLFYFFVLVKQFAANEGLMPERATLRTFLQFATLERTVLAGVGVTLLGAAGLAWVVAQWAGASFEQLEYGSTMRTVIPAVTAIAAGIQTTLAGFFSSILDLNRAVER